MFQKDSREILFQILAVTAEIELTQGFYGAKVRHS